MTFLIKMLHQWFFRFTNLRSINLADNNLQQFPISICKITSLVELNLASNEIKEVPSSVKLLEKFVSFVLFLFLKYTRFAFLKM